MKTGFVFAAAAAQVPFIIQDPSRWLNWIGALSCLGVGVWALSKKRRT